MLTQGMWMVTSRDCCVCAHHMDSLSDWAWTLQFTCKMVYDGLCIVVAQWDQATTIIQNVLEIPQQSIYNQQINYYMH